MAGSVSTNMTKSKGKSTLISPAPELFVEADFRTLGIETRTSGYWFHKILVLIYFSSYFKIEYLDELH